MATIAFCAGREAEVSAARWLAPALAEWPGEEVPHAERFDLDALLTDAESELFASSTQEYTCLFVVLRGDEEIASLAKFFDRLHGRSIPAVVIAPSGNAIRSLVHKDGVIVVGGRETAGRIAAMIFALCERQPLVEQLSREVRSGSGMDRGIRGEMDRLHEELHLAATVQRELLPQRLPEDAEIEFASLYHPATYVSGDLFDARVIDENRVAFFIADAVGHGVPAALITMMLSRALLNELATAAASGGDISPAKCLSGLNIELCHHAAGNYRFATAVCGVLDKRDFSIRLAGAGHPPSLLLHAGKMQSFESQGPLLGVFAEAEYTEERIELLPGATLLLYTDGFELAFPAADEPIADRRVAPREYLKHMGLLDSISDVSVHEGMERLARAIAGQEGSLHQRDDVTALAIRRVEAGHLRKAA
ncbi:MAG: serine/threonine-protein phosphatase [Phycisphaeraceae bacterium]|nr:serine/threonine-protein phosphatase [Phycisphaeraceae bacterium]